MKTQTLSKFVVISLFLLAFLMPDKIAAQAIASPYPVRNQTGCTIRIDYAIYKAPACTYCPAGPGFAFIPSGGVFFLPTTCGTACNIFIYLNGINGASVPVTAVDMNNPTNSVNSSNCGGPATYNLTWTSSGTTIN